MGKRGNPSGDDKESTKVIDLRTKKISTRMTDKSKVSVNPKGQKKVVLKVKKPSKPTIHRGVKGGSKLTKEVVESTSSDEDNVSETEQVDDNGSDPYTPDPNENTEYEEQENVTEHQSDENEFDGDAEEGDEEEEFEKIGEKDKRTRQKWSLKQEQELCTLWEEEAHLYDATCNEYRRTHLREAPLRRFSTIMKISVDDIQVHMNSLRTSYRKLLRLPSGSGGDRFTARQKEIMQLCKFLKVHLQNRDSSSNIPHPKSTSGTKSGGKGKATKGQQTKGGKKEVKEKTDNDIEPSDVKGKGKVKKRKVSDEEEHESIIDSDDEPAYYVNSKRKKANEAKKKEELCSVIRGRNEILSHLSSSVSELAEKKSSKGKEECDCDSFDLWARLLAEKLRKMENKSAERFKVHVDTLALDAMEGDWHPK